MVKKLVCGVGINDEGVYKSSINGKHTEYYKLWTNMLNRCYSDRSLLNRPTYSVCSVSEEFKYFQYFAAWCAKQKRVVGVDYSLDKDLLFKGNKLYSENTCIFIPRNINNALEKADAIRGEYPIGVWLDKRRGTFQCNFYIDGKKKSLPASSTPELAFYKYKAAKEAYLKVLAERYKDVMDNKAYHALYRYEIDIED